MILPTAIGLVTALGSLGIGHAAPHPRGAVSLDCTSAAKSAIDTMNTLYDETQGRWAPDIAWWISGVALQGVADFMKKTGSREYLAQANHIVDKQKDRFHADSTDDTAWWALALLGIHDLGGTDNWYLETAKSDEAFMHQYWSTDSCGGGLIQSTSNQYKNAISNQLYALLTASLHNRIPGDTEYLAKAQMAWDWLFASGMVNSDHLFNDGLIKNDDGTCANNHEPTWTYNQGVILGAATELYHATNNQTYLDLARLTADAVLASPALVYNGIVIDPCQDATHKLCNHDQETFKGIFARHLARLSGALPGDPYRAFLEANAESAVARARDAATGFFDVSWAGPYENGTLGTQASGLALLVGLI